MIATTHEPASVGFRIDLEANPTFAYRRELRSGIERALEQGETRIVVDCTSWAELDLILLSALVDCAKVCDEQGANFELENLGLDMRSRIERLRLSDRLGLRD